MKIIVLMSTYNGEKYLKDQLNSLVSQSLRPNKILIRDDGSTDSTLDIIKYYADNYDFIEYYQGENKGPAKSFWELINKSEESDYYALCDQDDVWLKDKIESAITLLKKENKSIPLLYCSKCIYVDEKLNRIDANISKLYSFNDFAHALLYQTAPGCTMVFNNEARKQIVKYDINKEYCMIHDSIIHKIVTMFGKMIIDDTPHIFYRLHNNNAIGFPTNKYDQFKLRVKRFLNKENANSRLEMAKSLLNVYGQECSLENKELLEVLANYQIDKEARKKLLNDTRFKTRSVNDLFFKVLVMFRYI